MLDFLKDNENVKRIEQLAFAKSKSTMDLLAIEVGWTTGELIDFFIMANNHNRKTDIEFFGEPLQPIERTTEDFWKNVDALFKRVSSNESDLIFEIIDNNVGLIPVNWGYVHGTFMMECFDKIPGLALENSKLDTPVDPLRLVLQVTPRIYYFNINFNAFVTGDSGIQGLPGICYYPHLFNVMTGFIDNMAWLLFSLDESSEDIVLSSESEIENKLKKSPILNHIRDNLNALIGASIVSTALPYDYFDKDFFQHSQSVQAMASLFVKFHEYGHLLLGHFNTGAKKELEYEADEFSNRAIDLRFGFKLRSHKIAAQTLVMILLQFREKKKNLKQTTHPNGISRIKMLHGNDKFTIDVWNKSADFINHYLSDYNCNISNI